MSDHDKPTEEQPADADVSPAEGVDAEQSPADEGSEAESKPMETVGDAPGEPSERSEDKAASSDDDAPAAGPEPIVELEHLLVTLADLARESGMRTLAAEVSADRIPALREGRISVVVLGEFNHGKSTILNALLGKEVLPTGITPTTAVITHLRWAKKPQAVIHYDESDRKTVAIEDLPSIVAADQTIEPQYVEVGYPAELLENNLLLVDTPGVNDISQQRVEITYGYVPKADVVVYVLDANQVLKKSEIAFIRDRLLRSNRDRLLFVLGKIDTLDTDERKEVEDYARDKLGELIGPVELFPVSAKRAMEAGDEGFEHFRERMLTYLKDKRNFIIVDSGVSGGLRIAGMLRQNLAIVRMGLSLDAEELRRRVDAVQGRIGKARQAISQNIELIDNTTLGLTATAKHNLREFTEKFVAALPREIERASTEDLRKFMPDWIRDTYKDWLEDEGNAIAKELERLAQDVIETTNRNLGEAVDAVQEELGLSAKNLDLSIDTFGYDVGVLAVGAVGVSIAVFGSIIAGGLVFLAAPILAIVLKDKAESRLKERAQQEGERAIREAGAKVEAEMVRVIGEYGEQLKLFVETAGDRLYKQVNEALEQVMKEVDVADVDRAKVDQRAADSEVKVTALIESLHKVRERIATEL